MIEQRWEVRLGSPVVAMDGDYGRLQQLILDPRQKRVLALAVRKNGLVTSHTVVVPQAAVAEATDSEVHLTSVMNRRMRYLNFGLIPDGIL